MCATACELNPKTILSHVIIIARTKTKILVVSLCMLKGVPLDSSSQETSYCTCAARHITNSTTADYFLFTAPIDISTLLFLCLLLLIAPLSFCPWEMLQLLMCHYASCCNPVLILHFCCISSYLPNHLLHSCEWQALASLVWVSAQTSLDSGF